MEASEARLGILATLTNRIPHYLVSHDFFGARTTCIILDQSFETQTHIVAPAEILNAKERTMLDV
jgi:hypothetical protein